MEIVYKPNFIRQYKKLPKLLQDEIKEKIEIFKSNPKHPFLKTHKLKGELDAYFSFSVNYKYRVIFEYEDPKRACLLAVGDHDIYN